MDCSSTQRRPGSDSGPRQFAKVIKYSPLAAIKDIHSTYWDCFDYMESEPHIFSQASFRTKFQTLREHCTEKDLSIVIGGDSSSLNTLIEVDSDFDVILKISPNLSCGPLVISQKMDNRNYITYLKDSVRAKVIHFGVLDYTNTQEEVTCVLKQDKASIVYLDKLGKTNAEEFGKIVSSFNPKTKVGVLIDCESFTPDYFPGVSDPSVFGLEEKEIFTIVEKLASSDINLKLLIFSNYNPAVESRRSGDVLFYLIYTLLSKLRSASSSVLAALDN